MRHTLAAGWTKPGCGARAFAAAPRRVTFRFIALLALAAAPMAVGVPALPQQIPDEELGGDPYRHVGLVRTDSYGVDPTAIGSGWVAGERVVASAAHVFYVDEPVGWNRNRWFWRRAAGIGAHWDTYQMMEPRSFRVLAGYAEGVEQEHADPDNLADALNRDAVALMFYRPVSDRVPPRASSALGGSGTYNVVGYPVVLGGVDKEVVAMHAHVGGLPASYTLWGAQTDFVGNPNRLFITMDLQSGPGGSGGPVFKLVNGVWTVVGTLLAGEVNVSSIAREVDAELETMLAQANADSVAVGPGEVLWEQGGKNPPVLLRDGSTVLSSFGEIWVVDAKGEEKWRLGSDSFLIHAVAEAPDGRILVASSGTIHSLNASTGEELWRRSIGLFIYHIAVGEIGEVYAQGGRDIARVSPLGELDWIATLPDDGIYEGAISHGPAVGADGTVYATVQNRLYALNRADGSVKWRTGIRDGLTGGGAAPGLDGSITVADGTGIARFEPDGTPRWSYTGASGIPQSFMVRGDGSVVYVDWNGYRYVSLNADGSLDHVAPTNYFGLKSVTEDTAGNLYLGDYNGVECRSPTGERKWKNTIVTDAVFLSSLPYLVSVKGAALETYAGAPADLWQPRTGGPNAARRVANSLPVAPVIVSDPTGKNVATGYRLELTAAAEGSHPLTFEWRKNGNLLAEHIGRRMIIPVATQQDEGVYTVTARNVAGVAVSEAAVVTVDAPSFGDLLWTTNLYSEARPAIAPDGTVYVLATEKDPNGYSFSITTLVSINSAGNERWRRELHRGSSASIPPMIGDDGRIYVGTPRNIVAISSAGVQLWSYALEVTGYEQWVPLSLAPDNGVYFSNGADSGRLDPAGNLLWKTAGVEIGGGVVRRDGSITIGPGRSVTASGVLDGPDGRASGGFRFLGPNEEWVSYGSGYQSAGRYTYDRDGRWIAFNPTPAADPPSLLLSDGMIVTDRFELEPFMGSGHAAHPMNEFGKVEAVLESDRILWISSGGHVAVYDKDRQPLESANIDNVWKSTVGPNATLVRSYPVSAFNIRWSVANTAWPMKATTDSRHTMRAPTGFPALPTAVSSAAIRGRADPTEVYDALFPYETGSIQGYAGYSVRLVAAAVGVGPFQIEWKRNGVTIAGAVGPELRINSLQTADQGGYSATFTTAEQRTTSAPFTITVSQPAVAPPGNYVRTFSYGANSPKHPILFEVTSDRYVRVTSFGEGGPRGVTRIYPDGSFYLHGIAGRIDGTGISMGSENYLLTGLETRTIAGTAPNGLPAGAYRGYATGANGYPVTMIVFDDGSFSWVGMNRSGTGAFVGMSLGATTATAEGASYQINAKSSGAIVAVAQGEHSINHTGYAVVWTERAEVERLVNISTRGYIAANQPPLIAGFVVLGSTGHNTLIRAAGPALADYHIVGPLEKPRLRLMSQAGTELKRSLAWHLDPNFTEISETAHRVGAFPLETMGEDAAMVASLSPSAYTAMVDGADGGTGVALVEVYEDLASSPGGSRLRNISTRGLVGSGERMLVGGFVITGEVPKAILIRAVGPSLAPYAQGQFVPVTKPRIRLYRLNASQPFVQNDDYGYGENASTVIDTFAKVGAFALIPQAKDAAMVVCLEPGGYTAVVDNLSTDVGVALLEIYEIPTK